MSAVNLTNVTVLNNPTPFLSPFQFEISYECLLSLKDVYKKHYPPALHDEVWRLDRIAKDGALHKKLMKSEVITVEDFLRVLARDPQRLRNPPKRVFGSAYYPSRPVELNIVFNRDELLKMVRFGAEMVFSSKDSTITDEDIDRIIARRREATAELDAKMKKFTEDAIKFKMDDSM